VGARSSRKAAALLALGGALLAGSGCGSSGGATQAGLRLQREDLIASAHEFSRVQPEVKAEVAATKAAWPLIAGGVPAAPSADERAKVAAARRGADGLHLPNLFRQHKAAGLTGPGAAMAGTFDGFVGLSWTGWRMIDFTLKASAAGGANARFARANSPLYVESVYDGHFGLSQVGKKLLAAYAKLGGPAAFGRALTQAEVNRLAAAYSEGALRLHPHPAVKLGS
jgi:hypothetical protein